MWSLSGKRKLAGAFLSVSRPPESRRVDYDVRWAAGMTDSTTSGLYQLATTRAHFRGCLRSAEASRHVGDLDPDLVAGPVVPGHLRVRLACAGPLKEVGDAGSVEDQQPQRQLPVSSIVGEDDEMGGGARARVEVAKTCCYCTAVPADMRKTTTNGSAMATGPAEGAAPATMTNR